MSLSEIEKLLVEAIDNMLDQPAKLGLAGHDLDSYKPIEQGYEYLHNLINDMFELRSAELTHSTAINQAFNKVHSYKYIEDPTFKTAMDSELKTLGIPSEDRTKAMEFIDEIIDELKSGEGSWETNDFAFNPEMDEIYDINHHQPEFNIIDKEGYTDTNVEDDKKTNMPKMPKQTPRL